VLRLTKARVPSHIKAALFHLIVTKMQLGGTLSRSLASALQAMEEALMYQA